MVLLSGNSLFFRAKHHLGYEVIYEIRTKLLSVTGQSSLYEI